MILKLKKMSKRNSKTTNLFKYFIHHRLIDLWKFDLEIVHDLFKAVAGQQALLVLTQQRQRHSEQHLLAFQEQEVYSRST